MSSYCQKNKTCAERQNSESEGCGIVVIKKINESEVHKNPNLLVKVTEMGNITEVQYMSNRNCKQTIQMLNGGNKYIVCATGEVKNVEHHVTRKDNKKGLYKTFANARALINTNVTDVSKVRWCTLTYSENMTDAKQLYRDFKKFNMRFQYYCRTKGFGNPEYIVMMEPQGRGAWHAHLLYIWQSKAPYIPNSDFSELWGHGFVKIKKLDAVDNVGAYLTAYLGDMEITADNPECISKALRGKPAIKILDVIDNDGSLKKKAFIKGARLDMYPANFNMIRYSKGIKKPSVNMMEQVHAKKKVLGATKTYASAVVLTDDSNNFETVIVKEYYNRIREKKQ